ncbi:hypothetical protein SEUBUCD646_0O00320 [Saccharomyces eubayanus]|uniref:Uncharacterized protein n=2 Tax=Saccharomyces TaxID=4930 RepID=A0A6C1EFL1_SACPS|nr:hypothetical protein GRS66_010557 [Saccharomyces pastorianus]CAI1701853.1 hypothetical protein SEUBUCD650_0O00320 [Saccharomyces eubayanus]CAI1735817.1 hypothetical protein SEUBUCD646_0O00320 [Saccharomyces eubayanus]
MTTEREGQEDVQYRVLQRAELAHSIWNLRFNLGKVIKRIPPEGTVFHERRAKEPQLNLGQQGTRLFHPDYLSEENLPLIREFKCLDSPPPVPPSSSQEEDKETTVDSRY